MFEIITIDELLRRLENYNHKELHVHHTWKPSHKDFNRTNGIQLQEGMRNYHVNTLKWQDIGQHVTLLPNGLVVTGRDFGKTPASIGGFNEGAFACEMLGNFDKGNDVLQGEQKDSIIKLSRYFDSKGRYVRFHRENASKSCPGTSIDKNEFMNDVRNVVSTPVAKPQANNRVKLLQELCNTLRCYDENGKALIVDGLIGKHTRTAVAKLPTIKINSNNDNAIRVIQEVVGAKVDGDFGKLTLAAVKTFQRANSLTDDGIIGPKTWSKILG